MIPPSLQGFLQLFWECVEFVFNNKNDSEEPVNTPVLPPTSPQDAPKPPTPTQPTYLWDTPLRAKHSVRVICDEEGLTLEQKNTLCATIQCESGFDVNTVHQNKAQATGRVLSTDYGICQWNDYYHGKEISPDDALHNPEKAVRLMCLYWKHNQRGLWVCYKLGLHKQYL